MHQSNQPKTTNTSTVRDAAVRIGAEEPSKGELIRKGLEAEHKAQYPTFSYNSICNYSYGALSNIAACLTSSDRAAREWAKKEVRRLVKLGKGE